MLGVAILQIMQWKIL